jgi:hypothetical protein
MTFMPAQRVNIALTTLQWTLGVVILLEAVLFVAPIGAHAFSQTHMPGFLRMLIGWGEIAGCIFILIPRTAARGAWLLAGVFVLAIVIHFVHGLYDVGYLAIYSAAAVAIACWTPTRIQS